MLRQDDVAMKVKKSELRLYCDLLMQQVHSVKCAVQNTTEPDVEVKKDIFIAAILWLFYD